MKKFILAILVLTIGQVVKAQPVPPTADDILKEACLQAAKENKNVFVLFQASWCVWCHRMDKSMNDESCKQFFDDNFVIRHLVVNEAGDKRNLEHPGGNDLKTKYNGAGQGIPYWLIVDKNGKLLFDSKIRKEGDGPEKGENSGCPATVNEVNYFIDVLKKTTTLNKEQLEIIRKRFRENEK